MSCVPISTTDSEMGLGIHTGDGHTWLADENWMRGLRWWLSGKESTC